MTTDINVYFQDGCGRCPLFATPQCKVHNWTQELKLMRSIILECGLTEEMKWGVPCYTITLPQEKKETNVLILAAFKEYCSISFFKGSLLQDSKGLLDKRSENTQGERFFRITDINEVRAIASDIKAYIFEAIEIEKAGLKIAPKEVTASDYPIEFEQKLQDFPDLKAAFEALTPGRQKGYVLHFSQPKQAKTRISRIEKCIPKILGGKGFFD
jgi:uncharacterized protein YdeI (YjbR/CyaY-like superfamily)